MNQSAHRDTLITIAALTGVVSAFVLLVLFPGQKKCQTIREEIDRAETTIREVPLRVAELESLHARERARREFLNESASLVPPDNDLHEIIERVARLVKQAGLDRSRLEPVATDEFATYSRQTFQLRVDGPVEGVARLLRGLEDQSRLYHVREMNIERQDGQGGNSVKADLKFSVYNLSGDSGENADSPESRLADI